MARQASDAQVATGLQVSQLDQEIFVPVHKFVRFSPREVAVLDHPACQRLRQIYQLGQTHLVFPGATHRRFEHVQGTVHVAQLIIDSLARNYRSERKANDLGTKWTVAEPLTAVEVAFVRLGALLHDVGHLPAGHTFEDELGLLPKHDADERLTLILDRDDWHRSKAIAESALYEFEYPGLRETLRALIDRLYQTEAKETELGLTASEILLELVSRDRADGLVPPEDKLRKQVCRDVIGNTICADILDYLHRDLHHLGRHKELDQRLLDYMELRCDEHGHTVFVVYLRQAQNVRSDAVTSILDLLESRYELFEIALYHRTKMGAAAMLERVVMELADARSASLDTWRQKLVEQLLDCTDEGVVDLLVSEAHRLTSVVSELQRELVLAAGQTATALRLRRLHKAIYQRTQYQLAEHTQRIQELYGPVAGGGGDGGKPTGNGPALSGSAEAAVRRRDALRLLELDFGLPPMSLAMYCPPRDMSTKIAGVKVLVDDDVWTLADHENGPNPFLTGGHLGAQQKRFKALWRIAVFAEEDVRNRLAEQELLGTLERAIDWLVLGTDPTRVDLIIRELTWTNASPWFGRPKLDAPEPKEGGELLLYPTGIPALHQYFGDL